MSSHVSSFIFFSNFSHNSFILPYFLLPKMTFFPLNFWSQNSKDLRCPIFFRFFGVGGGVLKKNSQVYNIFRSHKKICISRRYRPLWKLKKKNFFGKKSHKSKFENFCAEISDKKIFWFSEKSNIYLSGGSHIPPTYDHFLRL